MINSSIRSIDKPYQVLPLQARVDLGAMAIKTRLHSPKLQYCCSLTIRLFSVINRILVAGWGHTPRQKLQFCAVFLGVAAPNVFEYLSFLNRSIFVSLFRVLALIRYQVILPKREESP